MVGLYKFRPLFKGRGGEEKRSVSTGRAVIAPAAVSVDAREVAGALVDVPEVPMMIAFIIRTTIRMVIRMDTDMGGMRGDNPRLRNFLYSN